MLESREAEPVVDDPFNRSNSRYAPRSIRFGPFTADLDSQELTRGETRLRIPGQSFRILVLLLAKPGALVTREQMQQELWPSDTFVDFDHGLSAAVKRLRETLGDSADSPRYIETLPRRGYRFIGKIEGEKVGGRTAEESATPDVLAIAGRRRKCLINTRRRATYVEMAAYRACFRSRCVTRRSGLCRGPESNGPTAHSGFGCGSVHQPAGDRNGTGILAGRLAHRFCLEWRKYEPERAGI